MHNVCHRRPMRVSLCDPGPDGCAEMHAVRSGNWEGLRGRVAVSGVYIHARVTCHPYCLLLCEASMPSYHRWHVGVCTAGDLSVGVGREWTCLDGVIQSGPGIEQALNKCLLCICVHDACLAAMRTVWVGSSGVPPSMLNSSLFPGELLRWLEGQHLLHGLMASGDPMLILAPQPLPQASRHHHHRRATAINPARHCCLSGCTRQDLLTLCPH